MDDQDSDEAAAATAEMARAMGFSSFGAKKPGGKRKHDDARPERDDDDDGEGGGGADMPDAATLPDAKRGKAASGANRVPLRARAAAPVSGSGGAEIPVEEVGMRVADLDAGVDVGVGVGVDGQDGWTTHGGPEGDAVVGGGDGDGDGDAPRRRGGRSGRGGGGGRGRGSGRGARDGHGDGDGDGPKWYDSYFDPSSIENPWRRLELERGMTSRAS